MLSPAKRRQTVAYVREALGRETVSERRACKVLGQPRSTQLVKRMVELATEYGRYGYRRITAMLRREAKAAADR